MTKFSILTSVCIQHDLKEKQLNRCHRSIKSQFFDDWEWIIVNDGGKKPNLVESKKRFIIEQPHLERIVALNIALEKAKGEWIIFLDADDELVSWGLEAINQMIKANPKSKMFNFESIHIGQNFGGQVRGAFKPKEEKVGHEVFGGGNICNGTFVFHRSVLEDLGGFPESGKIKDPSGKRDFLYMSNPWDFSIAAQIEFPEIKQYFMVPKGEKKTKIAKEMGNPWGNDYYMFYKYTRKYHCKPYDIPLLIVHHEGKLVDGAHNVE
ncbi:MAG TPA: glycosyltransferase [bacterium]|nr:glycosyltransferase [bacterium]